MIKFNPKERISRFKAYFDIKNEYAKIKDVSNASFLNNLYLRIKYGFIIDNYFLYELYNKDKNTIEQILSENTADLFTRALNKNLNHDNYKYKILTYNIYKKYYKRTLLEVNSENMDEFVRFVKNHSEFIVKPCDSYCGDGIKTVSMAMLSPDDLYFSLLKEYNGQFLVEEKIIQAKELAAYNESSVNTLRIFTIKVGDKLVIPHVMLRIGRKGKNTDNFSTGGIAGLIDQKTATIYACIDNHGNKYENHPDSNKKIIGKTIPKFNEAINLIREISKIDPNCITAGWDLALTDDGWVLVEANSLSTFTCNQCFKIDTSHSNLDIYEDCFRKLDRLDEFYKIAKWRKK